MDGVDISQCLLAHISLEILKKCKSRSHKRFIY